MKIRKYIFGIGVVLASFLTACDTDNVTDMYENQNLGVTFTSEVQSVDFPAYDYEGFDVEVIRSGNISQAAEVTLKVSLLNGANEGSLPAEFVAPTVASFGAGEFKTMIHVKVGDIKSGKIYKVAFDIDEKDASVAATTRKVVSVYRDYTYSKIGVGKLVSTFFEAEGEVEFMRADDIYWYKAIAPYEEGYDLVFKIREDNSVLVEKQAIASDISGYGTAFVEGMGALKDGVIKVVLEFTVAPGSFGQAIETFVLPVEK